MCSQKTYLACCGTKRHTMFAAMVARYNRETAQIAALGNYIAWAQDVYPEERIQHTADLRKRGVFVGEFPTWEAAFAAATDVLQTLRARRRR